MDDLESKEDLLIDDPEEMKRREYNLILQAIMRPDFLYFNVLCSARASRKSAVQLSSVYLQDALNLLEQSSTHIDEQKRYDAVDSFIKNMKIYQIRFSFDDGGRKYSYIKGDVKFSGINIEQTEQFNKKYLTGNYFGEFSLSKKKDIALDNILRETDPTCINTQYVEEKMRLCLQNERYRKNNYVKEISDCIASISEPPPSKIGKVFLNAIVWAFFR